MELSAETGRNVTDAEITRRLRWGIATLFLALLTAVVFVKVDAGPVTRALLFIPFFAAAESFYQAVFRTCGLSGMRGMRKTNEGLERIADPDEVHRCRCASRQQIFHSFVAASLLTAVFVLLA